MRSLGSILAVTVSSFGFMASTSALDPASFNLARVATSTAAPTRRPHGRTSHPGKPDTYYRRRNTPKALRTA